MTNKEQIIIDGVNVSECQDFYISTVGNNKYCHCDCDNTPYLACKDNQNCYFKQLARKTQECEKLKSQVDEDYNYYTTELKTLRDIISNKEKRNAALFLTSGRYRKAPEEIEEQCKCFGRSKYTQEFDREYGGELDTNILDIIDKLKE